MWETDLIRKGRQRTAIPRRDLKKETGGTGPVTQRVLTPEELAEVIEKYGAPVLPLSARHAAHFNPTGNTVVKAVHPS
jgi:hypothetical protein